MFHWIGYLWQLWLSWSPKRRQQIQTRHLRWIHARLRRKGWTERLGEITANDLEVILPLGDEELRKRIRFDLASRTPITKRDLQDLFQRNRPRWARDPRRNPLPEVEALGTVISELSISFAHFLEYDTTPVTDLRFASDTIVTTSKEKVIQWDCGYTVQALNASALPTFPVLPVSGGFEFHFYPDGKILFGKPSSPSSFDEVGEMTISPNSYVSLGGDDVLIMGEKLDGEGGNGVELWSLREDGRVERWGVLDYDALVVKVLQGGIRPQIALVSRGGELVYLTLGKEDQIKQTNSYQVAEPGGRSAVFFKNLVVVNYGNRIAIYDLLDPTLKAACDIMTPGWSIGVMSWSDAASLAFALNPPADFQLQTSVIVRVSPQFDLTATSEFPVVKKEK
jgi:hypothetical protein